MPYSKASTDDVDSVIGETFGGMWFLRDALGTDELGVTIMELEPGARGKEHAHESQEEVYVCVEGTVDVDCGEETVTLGADEALWLSPGQTRQIHNRHDERAKLVLVGGAGE